MIRRVHKDTLQQYKKQEELTWTQQAKKCNRDLFSIWFRWLSNLGFSSNWLVTILDFIKSTEVITRRAINLLIHPYGLIFMNQWKDWTNLGLLIRVMRTRKCSDQVRFTYIIINLGNLNKSKNILIINPIWSNHLIQALCM